MQSLEAIIAIAGFLVFLSFIIQGFQESNAQAEEWNNTLQALLESENCWNTGKLASANGIIHVERAFHCFLFEEKIAGMHETTLRFTRYDFPAQTSIGKQVGMLVLQENHYG